MMENFGQHTLKSGPAFTTTPALQVLGMIGVVSSRFIVSVVDMAAIVFQNLEKCCSVLSKLESMRV